MKIVKLVTARRKEMVSSSCRQSPSEHGGNNYVLFLAGQSQTIVIRLKWRGHVAAQYEVVPLWLTADGQAVGTCGVHNMR